LSGYGDGGSWWRDDQVMSGHFILKSISSTDISLATSKGATWSDVQHADIGWTVTSRQTLTNAFGNVAIPNRDNLPPHRYLSFSFGSPHQVALQDFLRMVSWADSLVRPTGAGLELRNLAAAAQVPWAAGRHNEALVNQFQNGTVTIEVYYISGTEM
jgi:hypothetical protein